MHPAVSTDRHVLRWCCLTTGTEGLIVDLAKRWVLPLAVLHEASSSKVFYNSELRMKCRMWKNVAIICRVSKSLSFRSMDE